MPHILARKQADGSTRYTAVVRIRRSGKVLHREAKTFAHRSAAERWGKHREIALEDPAALARAQQPSTKLSKLIRWYVDSFEKISKWQRSKQAQLLFLEKHPSATPMLYSWIPQRLLITFDHGGRKARGRRQSRTT